MSALHLKDTEYGADFQPLAGVLYESCITLAADGDRLGIMGLHRPPGDRDFSAREKAIVTLLLPHFARSFHLLGLTQGRFPNLENGELVFSLDGRPLSMNRSAQRILGGLSPSLIPLPHDQARPTFFSTPTGIYRVRTVTDHPRKKERTAYLSPWPPRPFLEAKLAARSLSKRQREIAILAIRGYSNREIAQELFITEQTVKDHIYDIFECLEITRRTQLPHAVFGDVMRKAGDD